MHSLVQHMLYILFYNVCNGFNIYKVGTECRTCEQTEEMIRGGQKLGHTNKQTKSVGYLFKMVGDRLTQINMWGQT